MCFILSRIWQLSLKSKGCVEIIWKVASTTEFWLLFILLNLGNKIRVYSLPIFISAILIFKLIVTMHFLRLLALVQVLRAFALKRGGRTPNIYYWKRLWFIFSITTRKTMTISSEAKDAHWYRESTPAILVVSLK